LDVNTFFIVDFRYYYYQPKEADMKKFVKFFGVIFLQAIGTLVLTFIASMIWQIEFTQPLQFMLLVGWTFSLGIFLVGWLALKLGWLAVPVRFPLRAAGTLFGVYLPLVAGFLLVGSLLPGSPFFGLSILVGLLGFHLPSWLKK
jgi:hypothetical protein